MAHGPPASVPRVAHGPSVSTGRGARAVSPPLAHGPSVSTGTRAVNSPGGALAVSPRSGARAVGACQLSLRSARARPSRHSVCRSRWLSCTRIRLAADREQTAGVSVGRAARRVCFVSSVRLARALRAFFGGLTNGTQHSRAPRSAPDPTPCLRREVPAPAIKSRFSKKKKIS